jgi:nitrite reductase/ring-hydroxylating ferredoxin subunit
MQQSANEPAIPNRWYGVFRSSALRLQPTAVRRFGLPIVLYRRADGSAVALLDRCPHRGAALSRGRVLGNEIECPYHAFRFDSNGRCTAMPCEGPGARIPAGMEVPAFPVREAHGLIWLWWGATPEALGLSELPPLPWLAAIPEGPDVARSEMEYTWPASIHRTIEANFDAHHAPVIHSFGVPKLGRLTQVSSAHCQVEGEEIHLHVTTSDPLDASATFPVRMSTHLPGVSMIELGELYKICTVDTPIDDQQTWRCLIHVRPNVGLGPLGDLLMRGFQRLDYWVTQRAQDLPAVRSQLLPVPGVFRDKLVRADSGIAKYIHLRRKLLREEFARRELLPPHIRWAAGWSDVSSSLQPAEAVQE